MHISFSICFAIFAFALHMYVVALPLPVNGAPDWTHMLRHSPHHIASMYSEERIKLNIGFRRRRKLLYKRQAVKARDHKEYCLVSAHMAGVNTTTGHDWRRLANAHAGNETTWRERAELEQRGEHLFSEALGLHDIMRRH